MTLSYHTTSSYHKTSAAKHCSHQNAVRQSGPVDAHAYIHAVEVVDDRFDRVHVVEIAAYF